jgi:hypothetical protein
MLRKIALLLSFYFIAAGCYAQQMDLSKEEPTDFMSGSGKIYVVMAVAVVIVLGLLIYVINLDRKISKLEKERPSKG